ARAGAQGRIEPAIITATNVRFISPLLHDPACAHVSQPGRTPSRFGITWRTVGSLVMEITASRRFILYDRGNRRQRSLMRLLRSVLISIALAAACSAPAFAGPGSPMFDQATGYFNAGQYAQAADLYLQDLRLNPQDPLTHYYFGVSLHCLGRVPEATRE